MTEERKTLNLKDRCPLTVSDMIERLIEILDTEGDLMLVAWEADDQSYQFIECQPDIIDHSEPYYNEESPHNYIGMTEPIKVVRI